jgi:hypothetical protein
MSQGPNGVNAGYRGIALIDGLPFRFSDANIAAKQTVQAPDLVMGDWDKDAYVYEKVDISGSINGPVTETFLDSQDGILGWAAGRDPLCGGLETKNIELQYYCGHSRSFENLFVNSMSFSVAAGDIAQFSIDVIGAELGTTASPNPPEHFTKAEKLLTWDKVNVVIDNAESLTDPVPTTTPTDTNGLKYSNFEFSVNNNVEPVYGLGQDNLLPFDIVPGIRTITGSISVYNVPDFDGALTFEDYCSGNESIISFSLSSLCSGGSPTAVAMRVRFHRIEPTLSSGVIISTVGFTGVSHQSGFPWDAGA